MLALLCVAALAASALGSPSVGLDASLGVTRPFYVVQVIKASHNIAPAALISDKFAITLASLVANVPASQLSVRVGTDINIPFINPLGQKVAVANVLVHSDAEGAADVAILELKKAVPAKSTSSIAVGSLDGALPGSRASVASWGSWSPKLSSSAAWLVLPKYCGASSPSSLCVSGSFSKGALLVVDDALLGLGLDQGRGGVKGLTVFLDLSDPSVQQFIADATAGPQTQSPTAPTAVTAITLIPPSEITTEAPATEAPSTETPATEAPSTEEPSTEAPSTEAPSTEEPSTEAPSTAAPSTEEPSTAAPTTQSSPVPTEPTAAPAPSGKTCRFSVHDLPKTAPVLVKGDSLEFRDPDETDVVVLADGESIRVVCSGNKNSLSQYKGQQAVSVSCAASGLQVAGRSVQLSGLACKSAAAATARKAGKCGDADQFTKIEIGYEFDGQFVVQIDNCFDSSSFDAVYSRMSLTPAVAGHVSGVKRPQFSPAGFYENISPNALYNRNSQVNALAQLLGEEGTKYINSGSGNYFLSRGHLSAKADYILGAQQRATFYYVNAAPQWQTFNADNWEKVEDSVRSWVVSSKRAVEVITGTWDVATLPNKDGVQTALYLEPSKKFIRVPKYYWKIVLDPKTKEGVAFVGLNNPYHELVDGDVFCQADCSRYSWLSWAPKDQKAGYGFCCSIAELKAVVTSVPADIEAESLL